MHRIRLSHSKLTNMSSSNTCTTVTAPDRCFCHPRIHQDCGPELYPCYPEARVCAEIATVSADESHSNEASHSSFLDQSEGSDPPSTQEHEENQRYPRLLCFRAHITLHAS